MPARGSTEALAKLLSLTDSVRVFFATGLETVNVYYVLTYLTSFR